MNMKHSPQDTYPLNNHSRIELDNPDLSSFLELGQAIVLGNDEALNRIVRQRRDMEIALDSIQSIAMGCTESTTSPSSPHRMMQITAKAFLVPIIVPKELDSVIDDQVEMSRLIRDVTTPWIAQGLGSSEGVSLVPYLLSHEYIASLSPSSVRRWTRCLARTERFESRQFQKQPLPLFPRLAYLMGAVLSPYAPPELPELGTDRYLQMHSRIKASVQFHCGALGSDEHRANFSSPTWVGDLDHWSHAMTQGLLHWIDALNHGFQFEAWDVQLPSADKPLDPHILSVQMNNGRDTHGVLPIRVSQFQIGTQGLNLIMAKLNSLCPHLPVDIRA